MVDISICVKCKYSSHFNGIICCDYILIEKHRRGCYEGECKCFAPRKEAFSEKFVRGLLNEK